MRTDIIPYSKPIDCSYKVPSKTRKPNFTNRHTDWNKVKEVLESLITLRENLKTIDVLELQTQKFAEQATLATKEIGKTKYFKFENRSRIRDERKA